VSRDPGVRKAAKRARRRKRQAARDSSWVPEPLYHELIAPQVRDEGEDSTADTDPVAEAVAGVDEVMADRGWVLDAASLSEGLVSWVYPPSAVDFEDRAVEPVTRIWIAVRGGDEAVLALGATVVGSGAADGEPYRIEADRLGDALVALESYRAGDPRPVLS